MDIILVAGILASLVVGGGVGYGVRRAISKSKTESAEAKAEELIKAARSKSDDLILKTKEKAIKFIEEAKEEERRRSEEMRKIENRLEKRAESLDQKLEKLEKGQEIIIKKAEKVKKLREELEQLKSQELIKLEKIAKLSTTDAKRELLNLAEKEYQEDLIAKIKKLEAESHEELEKKAQNILTLAIQRCATSHASETTTTTLHLPSDEMKGRIIGREGRNIKTIENLTGTEIIVDDTPEAIVISGFDPVRRQVAKIALEKLIEDGRIHPGRIEETVEKAKKEILNKVKEAGEAAVYDTGVAGLDPKLVQILGRLRFRTSYGQNVLLHSVEVAHLAANLASELGLDVSVAKKAGLLHDIGKALDHEVQGTHVEIGINLLNKFKIPKEVIDAMKSHHEDYPYTSNEAVLVQTADAISSARPGARKDTLEHYINRLKELEDVANGFEGVEKSYAIQAGREIRVFVSPEDIDDLQAIKLSKAIADKIEDELKYPGEIKVCVIRETRSIEYAK
jgi:ribonuclease Y